MFIFKHLIFRGLFSDSKAFNTFHESSEASLQKNCNKEGFNTVGGNPRHYSRARIGIIGNNEKDCKTCDSRIGFGTGGWPNNSNSCGNEAKWSPDNGDKHIKAMGYILVQ